MNTWLSLLIPSNRPADLDRWLTSLYDNCTDPKSIQLSLVVEKSPLFYLTRFSEWGDVKFSIVKPGQYAINELVEIAYKQSTSRFIFLSGDDSICHTPKWDEIFWNELKKYPDDIILVYPDDKIFGEKLACYPVTSRLVMDKIPFPLPFKRYAIDDTIFNIVPRERRIYLPNVIMEHLHLVDEGPGVPVARDGKTKYYPINQAVMNVERPLYDAQEGIRHKIREELKQIAGIKNEVKIMIGVATAEYARKADFYDHFNVLAKPVNSYCTFAHGQSPARNRNVIIKQALDMDCTHIFFIDDDVVIPPDGLMKLLARDKDIVSGLYLMRNHPHYPIAFDFAEEDGKCRHLVLNNGHQADDLIEIVAAGLGCLLVKTDVFRAMDGPWIRLGELESDMWCDDLGFFKRAREANFQSWLDKSVLVGHHASVTIWPIRGDDGILKIGYDTAGKEIVKQ